MLIGILVIVMEWSLRLLDALVQKYSADQLRLFGMRGQVEISGVEHASRSVKKNVLAQQIIENVSRTLPNLYSSLLPEVTEFMHNLLEAAL